MSTATQPKPVPAVLVYGTPTSPELTQASWFRAEDKQVAKAAAETLKFSVIDIQTEAEKALTIGVHEGVLKGSGRMIVGSVSTDVYRRIEEYARKGPGADATAKSESIVAASAKPASEQITNEAAAAKLVDAATSSITASAAASPEAKSITGATFSGPATAPANSSSTAPESKTGQRDELHDGPNRQTRKLDCRPT